MAIGALLDNQWKGAFHGEYAKSPSKGTKSAMQWLAESAPEFMNPGKGEKHGEKTELQPKAPLSYSRRITASFKMEEFHASQSEKGETIYAYHASRQQFEVIINVNGDERDYSIKGIDAEGKTFEKKFDPYEVDPENADYTEFTALCLYIQRTDGYADSLMGNFGQSLDGTGDFNILEKRNYVSIFGKWGTWQAKNGNPEFYSGAMEMLGAIRQFVENKIGTPVSEGMIDLLFVERDEAEERNPANPAPVTEQKQERNVWEQSFDQIGKNAPESVKKAWLDAAEVIGVDGMGTSQNGKLTHISQLMVRRLTKVFRGEKTDDILGSSVQSAIRAVDNALYDLEHPLDGNRGKTPEQMKSREREKKFYQEFLKRLRLIG